MDEVDARREAIRLANAYAMSLNGACCDVIKIAEQYRTFLMGGAPAKHRELSL